MRFNFSFFRDRRGNITVLSALMMTALAGTAGLVAEYGNGLFQRLQDQRMADVAAVAGARVYSETSSSASMTSAIANIAALNGTSGTVAATIVSSPTGDGNQAVQVTVTSSAPLRLSRMFLPAISSSLTIKASAYAEVKTLGPGGGSGCILALDSTASKAITISGSGNVQSPNCDVISNSDNSDAIDMSGSAALTTPCTVSVGGQNTTSGLTLTSCKTPYTGAPHGSDPYASIANPIAPTSTCRTIPNPATNIQPGYYCNGINISGTATFQPGFYYVHGNLAFQGGSNVSATGVTFFVDKNGTTAISGSATVTLSAPTTGAYAGVLFFGDRTANTSNNNNISGSSSSVLTGALYFPTQKLTYSGGSSTPTSTCTQLVADTITFSGSTYMGDSCSGAGVQTITVPGEQINVSLVQ